MTQRRAEVRAPGEVGLYGLGYYTLAIVRLCRGAGIRVAFVVDDRPEEGAGANPPTTCFHSLRTALGRSRIPLWTGPRFIRRAKTKGRLPVLLASNIENRGEESVYSDPYLRSARLVRSVSGGNAALLHPVALAPVLPLPRYRRRVALFGFPGSGNILAQHLLDELCRRIDEPVPAAVGHVAAFAEHYYLSTVALLKHLLRPLRVVELELASSQFPTADLTLALPNDEYALALHIPSNRHLASYLYHTHAAPSRLAVEAFTRLGAPCVAVVRHPCETILSWASKLSRPPTRLLDQEAVFEQTVQGLAEWHRQLIANEPRMIVLRYEDLIARKKRPLQALADRLGVRLREGEIDPLYGRFLHRDLLPGTAPEHYYRSGNDKWKQYFLPRHLRPFLAHGFGPIGAHWGYDLTPPRQATAGPSGGGGGPSRQKAGVLPLDSLFALTDDVFALEPFPLLICSNSRDIGQSVRAALHGREFLDHLNAAGLGPEPPPWIAPIPWQSLVPIFHPELVRVRQRNLAGADGCG